MNKNDREPGFPIGRSVQHADCGTISPSPKHTRPITIVMLYALLALTLLGSLLQNVSAGFLMSLGQSFFLACSPECFVKRLPARWMTNPTLVCWKKTT